MEEWRVGHPKRVQVRAGGEGDEKVLTKWMAPIKSFGVFFVHCFGKVYYRITVSKKNLVAFFHHNYDYNYDYFIMR